MLILDGHTSPVHALAFAPDGRLAAGGRDGRLLVLSDYGPPVDLTARSGDGLPPVHALAYSPDGHALVVGGRSWSVRYDGPAAAPDISIEPDRKLWDRPVSGVGFVAANLIAIGYGDRARPGGGQLALYDYHVGQRRGPQLNAPHGVRAVATLPDRQLVAWVEHNRRLCVWDIAKPNHTLILLAAEPTAVALHPDGTTVAVADERTVRVFDIASRRDRAAFRGHTGKVTAVAYTPDGRTLATGGWDKTVRLWDAASGHCRQAFDWPGGKVYALAVAPDGLRLAAAGETGQVVVIDLE
jgi:WD40 repeat protein